MMTSDQNSLDPREKEDDDLPATVFADQLEDILKTDLISLTHLGRISNELELEERLWL